MVKYVIFCHNSFILYFISKIMLRTTVLKTVVYTDIREFAEIGAI